MLLLFEEKTAAVLSCVSAGRCLCACLCDTIVLMDGVAMDMSWNVKKLSQKIENTRNFERMRFSVGENAQQSKQKKR